MKQLLSLILFIAALQVKAQGPKKERIETLRIAFITEKLNLSSSEAEKFWPVYNRYVDDLKEIRQDKKSAADKLDNPDISENEAKNAVNALLTIEQKELDLKRKYVDEFSRVISAKKVALLFDAERDFRQKMLDKIQNGGGPQGPPMRGGRRGMQR